MVRIVCSVQFYVDFSDSFYIARNFYVYLHKVHHPKKTADKGLMKGTGNAAEPICCLVLKGRHKSFVIYYI
jgi:hypothetical protein